MPIRTRLKQWFKDKDENTGPREPATGCRMTSARDVTETERAALAATITRLGPWFHNYEIAAGLWTNGSGTGPGVEYPLSRWKLVEAFLPDLRGKSCLDVGCSSGFFALKMKELGASYVLGVDSGEQTAAIEQAQFAARTLQLDVDFRVMSAYDLARLDRVFDVVLFMGVFYHLRHPLLALEAARAVCNGIMIFQTITTRHEKQLQELDRNLLQDVRLHSSTMQNDRFPAVRFVENTLDGDVTCWFVPNPQAVAAMIRACGFDPSEVAFTNEQDVIFRCTTK